MSSQKENIKVSMRCRPLSDQEQVKGFKDIVVIDTQSKQIQLEGQKSNREQPKAFTFDNVYGTNTTQKEIYQSSASDIVEQVLKGFNGTIFAYGQTGTGKTHTMSGSGSDVGIMPRCFSHIFDSVSQSQADQYIISCSFIEIYKEKIRDLLSGSEEFNLKIKNIPKKGYLIPNLSQYTAQSPQQLLNLLDKGNSVRKTGVTDMNDRSSRSHSIFMINIKIVTKDLLNQQHVREGKLNLVDLAGSEKQKQAKTSGERLEEGISINKSLFTLGMVISALVFSKSHIPYSESTLTKLLQDSLGGNSKTVMIANIGPSDSSFEETLSTLNYANRAKNIKNKPIINEDPQDQQIRLYQEELERLKSQIQQEGIQIGQDRVAKKIVEVEKIVKIDNQHKVQELENKIAEQIKNRDDEIDQLKQSHQKAQQQNQGLIQQIKDQKMQQKQQKQDTKNLQQSLQNMKKETIKIKQLRQEQQERTKKLFQVKQEQQIIDRQKKIKEEELKQQLQNESIKKQQYVQQKSELDQVNQELQDLVSQIREEKARKEQIIIEKQQEKQMLHEQQYNYETDLKLHNLITSNFVPQNKVQKFIDRLQFDENTQQWKLVVPKISKPGSSRKYKQPTSQYSINCFYETKNPRFKHDNILELDLDLPEKTTQDFVSTDDSGDNKIRQTLEVAMEETQEDFDDNIVNVYVEDKIDKKQALKKILDRAGTAKQRKKI